METNADFEPAPGGVEVSFVQGTDGFTTAPDVAIRSGLDVRFAVVQETYVKGCIDMYFDAPLWRALVEFVRSKAADKAVEVSTQSGETLSLDLYLANWGLTATAELEPPPVITAMSGGRPALCMATEYWTQVGGPALYADSYTYALYSDRDVGAEVMAAIRSASARARWTLAEKVKTVDRSPPPSLTQRLKGVLRTVTED